MSSFTLAYSSGYVLQEAGSRHALHLDFTSPRMKHRVKAGRELLAQATRAKPGLRVLDATAGLGVDSFVLASRGCIVELAERSHTLCVMLDDALERARMDSHVGEIARRMKVNEGDAHYIMAHLGYVPDVILIDPMFPERRKRAEVRGDLQLLQRFLGKDEEARSLVKAARDTGAKRVVVKRPLIGGELPGFVPSYTVKGKASRFDVYFHG